MVKLVKKQSVKILYYNQGHFLFLIIIMAYNKKKRIGRLMVAAGAVSLLLANASATHVSQQASSTLQAKSELDIQTQQQSLMKLDTVQQVMNQALTQILVKNQDQSSIDVQSLQDQAINSNLSDKELNDELYLQLQSFVESNSEVVQGILSFDCVVGQSGCIYSDRGNLAQGKMIPQARNKLITALGQTSNKINKMSLPKISSNQLAQTSLGQKVGQVKTQSNKSDVVAQNKIPQNYQNLQQKSQVHVKSTRDNALIRKQKELLKDIKNPIDDMEQKLAKQVKHKVTDVESFQDYSKDLMMHSKDKFNNIFNSMNNYKKEEKHVDLHEEKAKLKGGHEIHEGDHRPFNYDVRKQHHTQGNQGVENVQHESDVHLDNAVIKNIKPAHIEKDRRPIDKTALMTDVEKHHHHHHAKPKEEVKLQKAQDLVDATKAKSHNSTSNAKLDELIKKHVNCPKCKDCPTCQCAAQSISPLEELATHSNELTFQSADEKPEDIRLQILPQDLRDYVTKEVQVLNSERIVGYNTYSNILEQEQGQKKDISIDSNSDFYNVTVNFIMKRKQSGQKGNQGPKELPISLYENSINEVERHQQKQAQEKADQQAEEESEPKVIMPNELTLPKKESNDKSVHQILQESRVTKEEDQIATMIQEQVDALGPSDLEEQSELVSLDSSVTNLEEQKLRNTLKNLPIELNNAQIADQLRNLTPKEAMQMFQESQKMGNRPANVINLQLSEESVPASQNATISASQVKSEGGVDSQEISKLDAMMKNETHRIEQSFTDYIIPENEKNMVASIFSQEMEKNGNNTNNTSAVQKQNLTNNQVQNDGKQNEHFEFLNRVQAKAQKMLEDEQKGVKHPLSGNKLTQMMYSQAKLEKDEDEIKNQTQGASNLSQMSQDDEDEEHTEIEHLEDNEVDENEIGHMTVEEQEIDPQQTHMSTVQSKSGKIKVAKSKLNKTIQKAENLKKKLNQLQALNTDGNEVLKIQAKTPKQAKTLKEIFDEIQFMDNLVKKEVEQETHMINEHQLKKDIRFNSKFLNKKLELDYDLPLVKKPTQKSASEKLGHLDQKKFNNPFKIKKTGGVSHTDKDAEMEKLRIHQEKMREHHDLIKKQIKDIFKGKNQLTKKELHSIENDPFFAHGLFAPPKEAEKPKTADPTKKPVLKDAAPTEEALVPPTKKAVKMEDITKAKGKKAKKTEKKGTQMPPSQEPKMNAPEAVPAPVEAGPNKDEDQVAAEKPKALAHKIIRRKRELDPHNLFHGKTRSQQKLRKLIRGKHHIAQTSAASGYDEEEYDENTQDQEQEQEEYEQSTPDAPANSNQTFSQAEILEMEEKTLKRKIDIDLKVLSKIEAEKDPNGPKVHYKIVKVEEERPNVTLAEEQAPESLAQQTVEQRLADEFVQSKSQNILEMKDVKPEVNQTQALTQSNVQQKVIQDMTELQKQFEETSKQKEAIKNEKQKAELMERELKARAEEEKQKRQELLQQAAKLAQADLVAKHALKKAKEQAAIDKEQDVLAVQKQLEEQQKILAQKQKELESHKQEAQKAKELVVKAEKEENEIKGRLEKEEKVRIELEKKEEERAQLEIKKTEELQKQHEIRMQHLIKQQMDLQKKKKLILEEQEDQRRKLEQELERVNKVKQDLMKVAEPEQQNESVDISEKKSIADNLNLLSQEQIVIQQAIDKVKLAEQQGEKKGLEEAQKLIKKQETQSLEQSEADMQHLASKFESSSSKVKNIISNFQKVHSDLQTLKNQYVQQLDIATNSSSNTTSGVQDQALSEEEKVLSSKLLQIEQSNLALKMQSKQRQMKQIVNSLDQIKDEIPDNTALQTQIQQTKELGLMDLVQIENELR